MIELWMALTKVGLIMLICGGILGWVNEDSLSGGEDEFEEKLRDNNLDRIERDGKQNS